MITTKLLAIFGVSLALIAVILGAFGAHALKERLSDPMLNAFEVGVRYQMYHGLGLIGVALLLVPFAHPLIAAGGWGLLMGTFIFSCSLYILALTGIKSIGMITPIGGVILVFSWLLVLIGLCKS